MEETARTTGEDHENGCNDLRCLSGGCDFCELGCTQPTTGHVFAEQC
jgi:hypothetical protein